MAEIVALLIIVLLSIIINRIATVALTHTGMSREMAAFQARSAFTTVGYTTSESENVVNHPVRRRIISVLMLIGNAGLVSVIAIVIRGMVVVRGEATALDYARSFGVLGAGLFLLWTLATSRWIDNKLFRLISWALARWTRLESYDFLELLRFDRGYSVSEVTVEPDDWFVGSSLKELHLNQAGINVLGIQRQGGEFVGTPVGDTFVRRSDRLIIYGARDALVGLDRYRSDREAAEAHWRDEAARRQSARRDAAKAESQRRAEREKDDA